MRSQAFIALLCLALMSGRSEAWWWDHCEYWGTCPEPEQVLAANCSDIISAESAALMTVAEDIPDQFVSLVTSYKAALPADAPFDYPMQADADLYKAIDCFEDAVDSVEGLEGASMTRRTERRLERALRDLSISLADLYTAVNAFNAAPLSASVATELADLTSSLEDSLEARNALFGCFNSSGDDSE